MPDQQAPYEVGAAANFMIGRSLRRRKYITHLKLQKLVYISYGFYLARTNSSLFEEDIEAWRLGPVIPELYHEFKRFGPAIIRRWSANFDYQSGKFKIPVVSDDDDAAIRALDFTWNHYGWISARDLVDITHAEGTPWKITRDQDRRVINPNLIRDHFRMLLNDST